MASSESQFTATAGEHFVAYRLALLGLVPALVRQAASGIDLLVTNADGSCSASLIIKTVAPARHHSAQHGDMLDFPFSPRSVARMADSTFVCFVDLQGDGTCPDIYLVPISVLKAECLHVRSAKYTQRRFCRSVTDMERFRNNWAALCQALAPDETISAFPAHARLRVSEAAGLRAGRVDIPLWDPPSAQEPYAVRA